MSEQQSEGIVIDYISLKPGIPIESIPKDISTAVQFKSNIIRLGPWYLTQMRETGKIPECQNIVVSFKSGEWDISTYVKHE